MKPTAEQIVAYINSDLDAPKPPSPYEIALTLSAALISSGRFAENPSAAIDNAWLMVLTFYQGQAMYLQHGQMLYDLTHGASPTEPEMSRAEGHAYVTGGETGNIGEVHEPALSDASQDIDLRPLQKARVARATHIAACDIKTVKAYTAWQDALGGDDPGKITRTKKAYDKAAAEQSKAHEVPII